MPGKLSGGEDLERQHLLWSVIVVCMHPCILEGKLKYLLPTNH